MLRNRELQFWTTVNFEVEYFLNGETEGVLTDTVIYFQRRIRGFGVTGETSTKQ